MDDPVSASANATRAVAEASAKALEVVHDAGGYLRHVLADVPADLIGVLGGAWLHERHVRIRERLRQRTEEILEKRRVEKLADISPNVAAALIAGAQEESREELAELWARLLAAALDPATTNAVRHFFFAAAKELDPMDVRLLQHMHVNNVQSIHLGGGQVISPDASVEATSKHLGARPDDIEVSLSHLEALQFLWRNNLWLPTAKMREFMRACYPAGHQ
jgi:hypothetical protein